MTTAADCCPGCGVRLPRRDGPTHAYMTSSPACSATFGELVAADYSAPERMSFHQLVVDSYAAQHPGGDDRRQVQSVGLHLMTLCLFLERNVDPARGPALHRQMIRRPAFRRLERNGPGDLHVTHVPLNGPVPLARQKAYEWARAVWATYAAEWPAVVGWLHESGFDA